jgi:hypothetical protein
VDYWWSKSYLAELSRFCDISFHAFQKSAVVGEECTVLGATATVKGSHATVADVEARGRGHLETER